MSQHTYQSGMHDMSLDKLDRQFMRFSFLHRDIGTEGIRRLFDNAAQVALDLQEPGAVMDPAYHPCGRYGSPKWTGRAHELGNPDREIIDYELFLTAVQPRQWLGHNWYMGFNTNPPSGPPRKWFEDMLADFVKTLTFTIDQLQALPRVRSGHLSRQRFHAPDGELKQIILATEEEFLALTAK